MKKHHLISITLLILIFVWCKTVFGEYQVEYNIQIQTDGSATWTITQTGTGIQASPITLYTAFYEKVTSIMETAQNQTGRAMNITNPKITINVLGSYTVIKYEFNWINFSKTEDAKILIGDAFQTENFFQNLYGEGPVYITYPPQYDVESVSPTPHQQNATLQMLEWYGTKDFKKGEPNIILKEKSASPEPADIIKQNAWLIMTLAALSIIVPLTIYTIKHQRRKREKLSIEKPEHPIAPQMESDEDKIIRLLKSAGGSLYQSEIAEQTKFSRAKTSNLLATLENKGTIKRYKKGRDKIVTLTKKQANTAKNAHP
ncbi:MAG: helix-turn-helix transcriptional regulator [Candidatus Bathyarchaeia archaeon]